MIIEFKLPELGENITSADIVKITVAPGDKVEVDQIVLEIETDKATVEVPSDKAGVVKEVLIKEGSTVKVSEVIFTMESDEAAKTSSEKSTVKTEVKTESPLKPAGAKIKDSKSSAAATDTWLYEFVLPELGENILTADITKILVKEGDSVEINQSVIEIETDKATVEVPSEVNGIVKDVKAREGEKANIGDVIFIFEVLGNADNKTMAKEPRKDVVKSETQVEYRADPVKAEPASAVEKIIPSLLKIGADVKIVPAAPTVRRFAREIGIDIHQVTGTGPGGRISIDDVKLFSKGFNERISKAGGGLAQYQQPLPDFSKWGTIKTEPMNNVRKKTADHLTHAWSVIPHVTQFDKADITELEKLRKQFSAKVEMEGGKLTVTAILLKVVSSALKLYPQFNSSIDMDKKEIIYKSYYNIGVAVDTEKGLLVPVLKDVDSKNITQISAELSEISKKARDKKISLEDMQGGTFTISNLGGIGGTAFTPIVNFPEVAILGVSRGRFEPVWQNGEFKPRLLLPLSLSYDHRIIDGADGIRFLRWIIEALENPFLLSLEG